jgi:hypothetical protein
VEKEAAPVSGHGLAVELIAGGGASGDGIGVLIAHILCSFRRRGTAFSSYGLA